MSNIPSRDQFLFTESFESLMNSNLDMTGGRSNKPSPGDALHQEALEYLKTTLKLKDLEARAYKSIAYRHVKENNPEAKHFERAEKMLELVKSKNFVKEYKDKLADTMKILEDIDSEKAKRNSETASQASTEEKVARRMRGRRQSGGNFSETSVDANYTESNMNKPFFNEYRAMKAQYLQAKLKQSGGNQEGGAYDDTKWRLVQPSYGLYPTAMAAGMVLPAQFAPPGYNQGIILNPTSPLHDLSRFMEIIKEDLMPNLMVAVAAPAPPVAGAVPPLNRERQAAIETFISYVNDIRTRWGF